MHTVRLSLFCAAALLVNGAYANDFAGSADATAKTADFVITASQPGEVRVGAQLEGLGELRQQASRSARDNGQWLRISDEGDTANREPRPADNTPRWVF